MISTADKRTPRLALIALPLIAAALVLQHQVGSEARADDKQEATVGLAVARVELYNAREDLRLWRELENQNIENEAVKQIIASNLVRHLVTIAAAQIDVRELKGNPLEALCLLTTEEAKGILRQSDQKDLAKLALNYVETIERGVVDQVREIQKSLRGTGCTLSPGEPHS